MKKQKFLLAAALIGFATLAFAVADNSNLVKIVHKGRVIEVAPQAVDAHLAHGDTLFGDGGSSSAAY